MLDDMGLLYTGTLPPPKGGKPDADWEPVPQLLFRSTAYGDEIDRPLRALQRRLDLFRRRHRLPSRQVPPRLPAMVDVWGADHGGYIKRMQAAVRAVTHGRAPSTSGFASWSTCSTPACR